MTLTDEQFTQLRAHNHLLLDGFWDASTCEKVVAILERRCTPESPWYAFPHSPDDAFLWELFTRPPVLQAAERYLGTKDIMLAGSHFQGRHRADGLDVDQRMHSDQGNNSLLVEPRAGPFGYFIMLTYWTAVDEGCGPTFILADDAAGPGEWPVLASPGSVLLYNLNLLHRGSHMADPSARRFVSWFIFKPTATSWAGQTWFGDKGEHPGMVQYLEHAGPRERNLVGVPLPGHPYWSGDTISRVQARYPGWDMGPYRAALA